MTINEVAYEVEQVEMELWSLSSLVLAINDAIVEGPNDAKSFDGALQILVRTTYGLKEEVSELRAKIYDSLRKEKKDGKNE